MSTNLSHSTERTSIHAAIRLYARLLELVASWLILNGPERHSFLAKYTVKLENLVVFLSET